MTITDLLSEAERAENQAAAIGSTLPPMITLKINKRLTGERCRIAPGLFGQVVQQGNGQSPSVVRVLCSDVRAYCEKQNNH